MSKAASTRSAASGSRIITSLPRRRRRLTTRRRRKSRRHRIPRRRRSRRRRKPAPEPSRAHRNEDDVAAAASPADAADHEHDEQKNEERRERIEQGSLMLGAHVGWLRLPFGRVGGERGDDVVDAAGDAAVEISGLESRRDRVGNDDAGDRVGQRALEAVADLDAHPPLLRRDQKESAVVLFRLAKFPGAEQPIGVRLDLLAVERGHGRHDELDAGLLLEIGELALEIGLRDRREDVRLVNDPSGQRGKVGRRKRRAGPQGREQRDEQRLRPDERRPRPKARHASAPVSTG